MPKLIARLIDWWAFTTTYSALRRIDPHLKADLALEDANLRRIARMAARHRGPISVYQLVNCDVEEFTSRPRRAPARHDAR